MLVDYSERRSGAAKRIAGAIALLAASAVAWEHLRFAPERRQACDRIGATSLDVGDVRVLVGSVLGPEGQVRPGHAPGCADDPEATALFETVRTEAERIPSPFPPRTLVVHLGPAARQAPGGGAHALVLATSGDLVVQRGGVDRGILLHELVHARLAPARTLPEASFAARVARALEEAVADYVAAVHLGEPRVGDPRSGPSRDLAAAPRASNDAWAALANDRGFDPHRLGWALAARWYATAPNDVAFARDLVGCFARAPSGNGLRAVLGAWLATCPPARREPVAQALRDWAPEGTFAE